ncbi:tetraacyldisaccharide 4'-kinase [Paludibacterium yongneupense]|uniref:tetraacyldisaccharide 4'-kinase n=1 Tax=Paludibacterium yongneupense TaxID=400061 RepID=UPI000419E0FF|nr:tetraacyldisaccharide 4'-kinase [Paludibacterium yongneupense]
MNWVERHWYRPRFVLTLLLWPLEALFAMVATLRRAAYRWGVLRSEGLPRPLVVIGNINVGGVGKTPLTQELIEGFLLRGVRVGIVSRGYGGAGGVPRLVTSTSLPAEVGDEPLMLAACGVPVAVGRDRVAAGRLLLSAHPELDLILSDDGLQHYRLRRDVEIAVVDSGRGFGNGRLLPNGPLREGVRRLETVDAVVLNGSADLDLPLPPSVPRFRMRLVPGLPYALGRPDLTRHARDFKGERVVALAGIGHPERFFATLAAFGIQAERRLSFPDHHAFVASDIPEDADAVLVTSKDAVKLQGGNHARLWVLPVRAALSPDLAGWILARLKIRYGR